MENENKKTINFTKMELDIETLVTVCFNFYIQGVQDGDSGELDRFTLKGEYSNNYEVFNRYFLSKGFIHQIVKGFFKTYDRNDPLWTARVRREDDTIDEMLIAKIRKDLKKYILDIPAEIDKELAHSNNILEKTVLKDLKSHIDQEGELSLDFLREDYRNNCLVIDNVLNKIQRDKFNLNDLGYIKNIEDFTEAIDGILEENNYKTANETMSDIYNIAYYVMLQKILKTFEERDEAYKNLQKFKEEYEKEHKDEEDDDDDY